MPEAVEAAVLAEAVVARVDEPIRQPVGTSVRRGVLDSLPQTL